MLLNSLLKKLLLNFLIHSGFSSSTYDLKLRICCTEEKNNKHEKKTKELLLFKSFKVELGDDLDGTGYKNVNMKKRPKAQPVLAVEALTTPTPSVR